MRLLLVEDDPSIAVPLREGLERSGFEVTWAATGAEALLAEPADLVLLDLGLPDVDGSVVCRRLRERSTVPIIVVTARGDEIDRVLMLEMGADDYVVKPFGFRELVARVRAVSRRSIAPAASAGSSGPAGPAGSAGSGEATASADVAPSLLAIGDLRIDRRTHSVELAGRTVLLTPKEYDLLVFLASDPGAVRGRDELMRAVWDEHWWGSTKTLDVHVASLRKKLRPGLIETVRSVGYRLDPS